MRPVYSALLLDVVALGGGGQCLRSCSIQLHHLPAWLRNRTSPCDHQQTVLLRMWDSTRHLCVWLHVNGAPPAALRSRMRFHYLPAAARSATTADPADPAAAVLVHVYSPRRAGLWLPDVGCVRAVHRHGDGGVDHDGQCALARASLCLPVIFMARPPARQCVKPPIHLSLLHHISVIPPINPAAPTSTLPSAFYSSVCHHSMSQSPRHHLPAHL